MFCAIPFPGNIWDEDARHKMLLFLPVVGLEIGLIWAAAAFLTIMMGIPQLLRGAILCVLPFALTGFIHFDGFMDVTDAVKSCRDLEKRRKILKDPHVGSFAVIGCVLLLLFQFSVTASLERGFGLLVLLPAVSRCCSALAVTILRPMSTSQYATGERKRSAVWILSVQLVVYLLLGWLFFGSGVLALGISMAGSIISIAKGFRSLDGMNGDISGYAITLGELWGLIGLLIVGGML